MYGGMYMTNPLAGRTICFSGVLSTPRKEAKAIAERAGARVADAVTKRTDFLVVGHDAGAKLVKAESLGIAVLSETEWLAMVRQAETR
jgi:DNA ligase (NAD+)